MFSGIVEESGIVRKIDHEGDNIHFTLSSTFTNELKIDQSLSHNGVCLTVVKIDGETYVVTAIKETLERSNLGLLQVGDKVNLERSMRPESLLDGHIVQGHVDQTATCTHIEEVNGSHYFTFEYEAKPELLQAGYFTVEKGSVTVNGVSLTVCDAKPNSFRVAIIPYTYELTNFHTFKVGTIVNLEFDIIGKYVSRFMQLREA